MATSRLGPEGAACARPVKTVPRARAVHVAAAGRGSAATQPARRRRAIMAVQRLGPSAWPQVRAGDDCPGRDFAVSRQCRSGVGPDQGNPLPYGLRPPTCWKNRPGAGVLVEPIRLSCDTARRRCWSSWPNEFGGSACFEKKYGPKSLAPAMICKYASRRWGAVPRPGLVRSSAGATSTPTGRSAWPMKTTCTTARPRIWISNPALAADPQIAAHRRGRLTMGTFTNHKLGEGSQTTRDRLLSCAAGHKWARPCAGDCRPGLPPAACWRRIAATTPTRCS